MTVVYEQSDVLGAISVADIGADMLLEHAVNEEAAEEAIDEMPSVLVTDRDGRICSNAGVDWPNAPEDMMTLLPEDPDESARRGRHSSSGRPTSRFQSLLSGASTTRTARGSRTRAASSGAAFANPSN